MEDRCCVCSEGFYSQCVYFAGHKELHRFGPMRPWPPAYYQYFEANEEGEPLNDYLEVQGIEEV